MITLNKVTVRVGHFSIGNISLEVPKGQYGFLMGRTGCGKTTLLEAICGLRPVLSGEVRLNGNNVTQWQPARRGVGLVPQDGALFQHMTVREHLHFPLRIRHWTQEQINPRVQDVADWLDLGPLLHRKPAGLSGGEAQRVALGRALAFRPEVLCLDEPLSALDEDTRSEMCGVLESVRKHTGVTILHITHSLSEAERLGDRIYVLQDGRISLKRNGAADIS